MTNSLTPDEEPFTPRQFMGVAVSSTFRDLDKHRAALIKALEGQSLHPLAMEHNSAMPAGTVVDSSLRIVRDAAAYVGIISHRYGQVPEDDQVNPKGLSLTELEFREARRLGRPILIFIMGEDHEVKLADVEQVPQLRQKLSAFREEVKRAAEGSTIERVYQEFNSLSEFAVAAMQSVSELRQLLDAQPLAGPKAPKALSESSTDRVEAIPEPPALYAVPPYIGSHAFLGRAAQLDTLTDWAGAAEPRPILMFEAIGGAGKSILSWEWMTIHANVVRDDWAGVLWYSFYENGAVMADFCRQALAYMTRKPESSFRKTRQPELGKLLLRQLRARPWLLVLDGLERVLVAYHRFDAAQLPDEHAGRRDAIADRDPSAAIRPQDDDLLRQLAGAGPSKILITSRLVPRVLVNPANQPIPGVLHQRLPGLRPTDAESLLRSSGVRGDSSAMQNYLQSHCDCHPLVTGVVAGLVNNYLPERGNFDAWAADPAYGSGLNLAELDLVQKRNHILKAALTALSASSRRLLSMLSLVSESVDYATLEAFNSRAPSGRQVDTPEPCLTLDQIVQDLERRGLLQYDHAGRRWDLHPVVRGVAVGQLGTVDRDQLGQQVVDYFSERPHSPYEDAETLDDLRDARQVIRTLAQIGRLEEAADIYRNEVGDTLLFTVDAPEEALSLLRSFFADDWTLSPDDFEDFTISYLTNCAGMALQTLGQVDQSLKMYCTVIRRELRADRFTGAATAVANASDALVWQNRLAKADLCSRFALELAEIYGDTGTLLMCRLGRFRLLDLFGQWSEADNMWRALEPMSRELPRFRYRPGEAEARYAVSQFHRGQLTQDHLVVAEHLTQAAHVKPLIRRLEELRGVWLIGNGEWAAAYESLRTAVQMSNESGQANANAEAYLALARFRLGQVQESRQEAVRLSSTDRPAYLALATLWHALGDTEQATHHALAAHRRACADGAPYVHRFELNRAADLLTVLGVEIPQLPSYDPAKDEILPVEEEIATAIRSARTSSGKAESAGARPYPHAAAPDDGEFRTPPI